MMLGINFLFVMIIVALTVPILIVILFSRHDAKVKKEEQEKKERDENLKKLIIELEAQAEKEQEKIRLLAQKRAEEDALWPPEREAKNIEETLEKFGFHNFPVHVVAIKAMKNDIGKYYELYLKTHPHHENGGMDSLFWSEEIFFLGEKQNSLKFDVEKDIGDIDSLIEENVHFEEEEKSESLSRFKLSSIFITQKQGFTMEKCCLTETPVPISKAVAEISHNQEEYAQILIYNEDKTLRLGFVDKRGVFNFTAAQDFRTWLIFQLTTKEKRNDLDTNEIWKEFKLLEEKKQGNSDSYELCNLNQLQREWLQIS